jgi:hypothetical protein
MSDRSDLLRRAVDLSERIHDRRRDDQRKSSYRLMLEMQDFLREFCALYNVIEEQRTAVPGADGDSRPLEDDGSNGAPV